MILHAQPPNDRNLRKARSDDTATVTGFLLALVGEMASLAGQAVAEERAADLLRERFVSLVDDPDHLFLLAEEKSPDTRAIGVIEASVTQPHPVFKPRRMMHIHALYVAPDCRRQGVARRLAEAALDWGRAHGCVEAELNVLEGNPARRLYEGLGFRVAEYEMRRSL